MTIEQIIRLIFDIVIVAGIVIVILLTRRRYDKTKESADLQKLRCKKDQINAIMARLVNYADQSKEKIKLLWETGIIDEDLKQLKIVLAQYNVLKEGLTAEQLEHEKEDYNKAVSNITKLFASIKTKTEDK